MTALRRVGQLLLLTSLLLQHSLASPVWERILQDDLERVIRGQIAHLNAQSLVARNFVDALVEARLGPVINQHYRRSGPHTRQLGDMEFSNRYSEFLRAKAKHASVCSFLHRLHSVKKSGLNGETENVKQLLKQYMCPHVYEWASDL